MPSIKKRKILLKDFLSHAFQNEINKVVKDVKNELALKSKEIQMCVNTIVRLRKENIDLKMKLEACEKEKNASEAKQKIAAAKVMNLVEQVKNKLHARNDLDEAVVKSNLINNVESLVRNQNDILYDRPPIDPINDNLEIKKLSYNDGKQTEDPSSEVENDETCKICKLYDPPHEMSAHTDWIGCDCGAWFHISCLGMKKASDDFSCNQLNRLCNSPQI